LADEGLDDTHTGIDDAPAVLSQVVEAALDLLFVAPCLAQMALEKLAVVALGRHPNVRLEGAHERNLGGVRLVQVLDDLLVSSRHCGSWRRWLI